jgi:hypothetical protein
MYSLVLNAAEYYTAAVATVINRAGRQGQGADLGQTIAEVGVEYQLYKRYFASLKSGGHLSQVDLAKLVSAKVADNR